MATAEFHYRLGATCWSGFPGCEEHSVVARAAARGVPIYTSSPGDSSIGMNIAYHELINDSSLMIDPNKDVNEVCAIVLAGKQNGCVILGGGSPKNFYLQAQPTLWEVYGIPKGGNDYFIQITTDWSSGAGCRARRRPRRSAGARSIPACYPTRSSRTAIRPSPFRCSASTRSARRTAAGRGRSWCTSATRWSPI